jgi:hypothetical protein
VECGKRMASRTDCGDVHLESGRNMTKPTDCGDDHIERGKHIVNPTDCGDNRHHYDLEINRISAVLKSMRNLMTVLTDTLQIC